MTITVYGCPKPQGSKRFVGLSKKGTGILVESCREVKSWREAVKWAAIQMGAEACEPIDSPVSVKVAIPYRKPKGAPARTPCRPKNRIWTNWCARRSMR